ncbi:MAG: CAP domain-containing protein, partial [Myxococcota bacterium]|nr:CAP domain-containing protein [Myxococcota bacterium]
ERLRTSGLEPIATGENVVHSPSLVLAHHALWQSPSHRANILGRSFDRVGVGAVTDGRGDTWAVELFTGGI